MIKLALACQIKIIILLLLLSVFPIVDHNEENVIYLRSKLYMYSTVKTVYTCLSWLHLSLN